DQPLLEVQADKAALDVPSPVAGRVLKVLVKVGDQVKVGQSYCVIEASAEGANGAAAAKPAEAVAVRNAPAHAARVDGRSAERAVAVAAPPVPPVAQPAAAAAHAEAVVPAG